MVYAHRPQAFRRRDHRTDSREPALASAADQTAEGGTCSKPPYFAARVDACPRTRRSPVFPCTHVAIARLPRTDPRSLEIGEPIGSSVRSDRNGGRGLLAVGLVGLPAAGLGVGAWAYHGAKPRS